MGRKFHINRAGRTEPCRATVRACPLGESAHYDSLSEAVQASLAPTTRLHQNIFDAKNAPHDLVRFFATIMNEDDEIESVFFSPRAAYRGLIYPELGKDYAEALEDYPAGEAMRDALTMLASPDFVNDNEWRESDERRMIESEAPSLLARLEDQAETAAMQRLFFS